MEQYFFASYKKFILAFFVYFYITVCRMNILCLNVLINITLIALNIITFLITFFMIKRKILLFPSLCPNFATMTLRLQCGLQNGVY